MKSLRRKHRRLAGPARGALRCGLAALLFVAVAASVGAAPLQAPDLPGMVRVTVEVELSCPSCAAGLERRLGRVDYVAGVEVNPADGQIVIAVEPGHYVDVAAVRDTVRNVGFVPDGVVVTAIGYVTDRNGTPALALSPDFALPLVAGDDFTARATAVGEQLVRVTGHWIAPQDDAARLRVESLEVR